MTPVEVMDLRLADGNAQWLAEAVVRVGPVEIGHVRVIERKGCLLVKLPSALVSHRLVPAITLDEDVFLKLKDMVLAEYRTATWADPWADERRASAG